MEIQKQSATINFAQGLETKLDPFQVPLGKFLSLVNVVFDKIGQLTKRNGFGSLPALPSSDYFFATTFRGNLTAIGNQVASFSGDTEDWFEQGPYIAANIETSSVVRGSFNIIQSDSATAQNGSTCVVFTQEGLLSEQLYYFAVYDETSQVLLKPTAIISTSGGYASGPPRVFWLNNRFVIVFPASISSVPHLQFQTVNSSSLAISDAVDITSSFEAAGSPGQSWDGVVANNTLYLAWNGASASGLKMAPIYSNMTVGSTVIVDNAHSALVVGVGADTTQSTPVIWAAYKNSSSTNYVVAVDQILNTVLSATLFSVQNFSNITVAAQDSLATIYGEVIATASFDSSVTANYISTHHMPQAGNVVTITIAAPGVITTAAAHGLEVGDVVYFSTTGALPTGLAVSTPYYVSAVNSSTTFEVSASAGGTSITTSGMQSGVQRFLEETPFKYQVGLASKAVILDGTIYLVACFYTPYQPTYFLMNESGQVVSRFAYQNGSGVLLYGIPSLSIVNVNELKVPYLYKAIVQSQSKTNALSDGSQPLNVYAQLGVNLATFQIGVRDLTQIGDSAPGINLSDTEKSLYAIEAGSNLNISGGFLWAYDGALPNENNFFVWPELVLNADGTYHGISATTVTDSITGDITTGSNIITDVSDLTEVYIGSSLTGVGIPVGAIVTGFMTDPTDPAALAIIISANCTATTNDLAITVDGSVADNTYYYRFTYEWTDAQGNVFRSAPSIPVSVTTTGGDNVVTIYVPNLTLTYKTEDVATVKIVGYRYSNDQQSYYQFTSVSVPRINDVDTPYTVIYDANSDETILGNNLLYTTGGVLENVGAPSTKAMTLFDNRLWMLDAENDNLAWFSKELVQGSPVEMSDLNTYYVSPTVGGHGTTGPSRCLAAMDDKLIIAKPSGLYYVNGKGPDNTGANRQYSEPIFITSPVGSSNQKSFTMIPRGLMFQADQGGIWILERNLNVSYIGMPVAEFNSYRVLSATTVPQTTQARFLLDNGSILVYDYLVDQWGEFQGAPGVSSCVYAGQHTLIDQYGRAAQETPNRYLDGSAPVLMSFQTSWVNLAGLQGYQRAYFFYLLGKYLTPHKLLLNIAYDYNSSPEQSSLILPTNYSQPYGGPTPNPGDGTDSADPYGQGSPYGGPSDIEQWRVFLKKQRCQSFQITVQEVYDSSFGVPAGAGLTLSGINLIWGYKKSFRPISAAHSIGGGTK